MSNNVWSFFLGVFGGIVWFVRLEAKVKQHDDKIGDLKQSYETLTSLKEFIARLDERYESIDKRLQNIEKKIL